MGLAALLLVGCTSVGTPTPQEIDARVRAHRAVSDGKGASAPPVPAQATPVPPPRDPAVRAARARAALPPGAGQTVVDVGGASPYVFATMPLRAAAGRGGTLFGLVDVRANPGVLVGRHDFPVGDVQIGAPLSLETTTRQPVLLAELAAPSESSTCGWWISPQRPRFLCAPKVARASIHSVVDGLLVESWETEFPPLSVAPPTRTGRMVRLSPAGRWAEIDSFRCLGKPLAEATAEATRGGVRRWQRDSIRRLTRVARHRSETFDDERASSLLRDAIAIDSCDADPWRLLGRLEYQAGRTAVAVPALAAAVALDSRDPASLVDLADALVALDVGSEEGREAFSAAQEMLARPPSTRTLVEAPVGPKALARGLYETYLEQTDATAARHHSRRRRVEGQLEVLY